MSQNSLSVTALWSTVTRMVGVGSQKVVPKGDRSTKEETDYFHKIYEDRDNSAEDRKKEAPKMVDTFYDLVTDFYESGWGQCFHFAPRGKYETFNESITRHEYYLASNLQIQPTENVLDCGMGIGGPMRNIAQFTRANISGITINEYQVRRANALNKKAGLHKLCHPKEMNFLDMKFDDNTFDKIFSIEATCHAGNREDVFGECYRVLKPGGLFGTYEWVMTGNYDPENKRHVKIRQQIEKGNALPQLITGKQSVSKLKNVGFEIIKVEDLAQEKYEAGLDQRPWYNTLQAGCSLESLPQSRVGIFVTHKLCMVMEKLGLAPKGTVAAHEILVEARDGLVDGGLLNIFTPMMMVICRKPVKSKN
jgi:sterol 24-C-methyltransferase